MTDAKRGPVHVAGELLDVKKVGAYRHVTLVAPGIAERFRPGNFVAVSVAEAHLARRAFWIHRARPTGGYGATIELVVADNGFGSHWLGSQPPRSRIELTGPLGRPFALPKEPVSCLLVGEGYAAATLFPLAERLRERTASSTCSWAPPTRLTCCRRWRPVVRRARSRPSPPTARSGRPAPSVT